MDPSVSMHEAYTCRQRGRQGLSGTGYQIVGTQQLLGCDVTLKRSSLYFFFVSALQSLTVLAFFFVVRLDNEACLTS